MNKLMILLLTFFITFLALSPAQAARVVSDPYLAPAVIPDYFTVVLNGGSPTQSPIAAVPGGQGFSFTIDGLASGDHEIKVTACKDFGTPFGVRCSSEAVKFASFVRRVSISAPFLPMMTPGRAA